MLRAGSLLYALYVCLLISILCGAFIFIFNSNLEFSSRVAMKSELVDRCTSCINFYMSSSRNFNTGINKQQVDIFEDGIECEFSKTKWGVNTILNVKAFFKKDTIQKRAFVGEALDSNRIALYLCDWGQELKVSGSTRIMGDMYLPTNRYNTVNILGNGNLNRPRVQGSILLSDQNLQKTVLFDSIFINEKIATFYSEVKGQKLIYNDFGNRPLIIGLEKNDRINNINIKGNVILFSNDTIYIESSSKMEDIIVKAPKVVVQKGFVGNLQIFATNEVIVEENVLLEYPSCILINSTTNTFEKRIFISKNSQIFGGVVMEGLRFDEKETNEVVVEENALIVGDLYCNGKLELKGKVHGTVFAHKLKLKTNSGNYENVLLNAGIEADSLPYNFIRLPLFNSNGNKAYGIIKQL